jgi:hypothetical protein
VTSIEYDPGLRATVVSLGPPEARFRPDGSDTPRVTPLEWARRRRMQKAERRDDSVRNRALRRLRGLGREWHLIEGTSIGLESRDAFVAIGPGGIFAVTVKSQGRNRVRLSGDTIQINGRRPPYIAEARKAADAVSVAFTRTAGTTIPVTPVLALAGTGLITIYGVPRGCVVMPYRELDNLFRAYGDRIAPRTVDKLASIARHPSTVVDLPTETFVARYR